MTTMRKSPITPPENKRINRTDSGNSIDCSNHIHNLRSRTDSSHNTQTTDTSASFDTTSYHANVVNSCQSQASNRQRQRTEAQQDRILINAAQRGDPKAFEQLVRKHQRGAFAVAYGYVHNRSDAKELTQEAFLRAFRALDRFQGESSFYTWLYRIVTNLCIDFLRRPNQRQTQLDETRQFRQPADGKLLPLASHLRESDPARVVRTKELATRLQQALHELPPYHLGVIMMREIDGMSYQEMADAMGVSKGTIMSRLFHARQKLQASLKDCYEQEYGSIRQSSTKPMQPNSSINDKPNAKDNNVNNSLDGSCSDSNVTDSGAVIDQSDISEDDNNMWSASGHTSEHREMGL